MDSFAEILSDLILESGKSLRSLADECGVSAVQLGKYTKGSLPTINVAIRIANYFKLSLDYLFGLTDKNSYKEEINCNFTNFVVKYEKILKDNKTTHYKFARANNLSESCLRHWKYGQIPKMTSLILIAKTFDVSLEFLAGCHE